MPAARDWTTIGVIDLMDGRAVRAVGGDRVQYQPVTATDGSVVTGDALSLARFYTTTHGLRDVYVADLDAIRMRPWHEATVRALAAAVPRIWLDAGVSTASGAERAIASGAARVVVGLETLTSFRMLREMVHAVGHHQLAFSLDLRDGVPVRAPGAGRPGDSATALAGRAADCGVDTIIVLDLARVGHRGGCDMEQLAAVRHAVPEARLMAGGGVRGTHDMERLAAAGCDGALVATALLTGALSLRPPGA